MSIKIKLNIIKPSKDLLVSAYVYTVISRARHYLNQNNMDLLVMFSFINKDWNNLIDNIDYSKQICDKLLSNKKLTKDENKILNYYKKVINPNNFKIDEIYYDKTKLYKKKIIPKLEQILDSIFTDTKAKSNIGFIYQPLVGLIKGSALQNSVIFSVENNYKEDSDFFRLLTHELIHVVCRNNKNYFQDIYTDKYKINYIFDEVFTGTIENICMYKLDIDKKKFKEYRFDGRIYNKSACKLEDKIRKYYNSWEKSIKPLYCFRELLLKRCLKISLSSLFIVRFCVG